MDLENCTIQLKLLELLELIADWVIVNKCCEATLWQGKYTIQYNTAAVDFRALTCTLWVIFWWSKFAFFYVLNLPVKTSQMQLEILVFYSTVKGYFLFGGELHGSKAILPVV